VKIYTRRGDAGETDLFGAGRVAKDAPRVEAYGDVDEANAAVGVALSASPHADVRALGQRIQEELFTLGASLAAPDPERRAMQGLDAEAVVRLEAAVDAFEKELPPLERFILPGGTAAAAAFHAARTVCRRAERRVVALHRSEPIEPEALRYLNRLSDLLFVLARVENRRAGVADVEWAGRRG
jgi:cob(I)alamin adenosyltransferase